MATKYFVETYGCQMNFHDGERISGLLESHGFEPACDAREADVVVVNTCSVRERAEEKLYTRLGELHERTGEGTARPVIAVTGCVAQQEGADLLRRRVPVDLVVGTQQLLALPGLVEEAVRGNAVPRVVVEPRDDVSFPLGVVRHSDPVRAWVTIIEGCNEFCAFCVVPYTRGHERMRPVRDILAEVREAVRQGRSEIQFLGQIVNHYQAPDDPACDFASLLERAAAVPGVRRIRFASPHPRHVTSRLIDVIRDVPAVCKHLHLPVQSGSDRVLKVMRRRHTRQDYLQLVSALRRAVPGLALSTDIIVGFPGESAEDFDQTLDLVRQVRYQSMFSFKYSVRPNTLAAKRLIDDVPEAVKTARIVALQTLQREIQMSLFAGMVGRRVEVLVDGPSRRRSWEVTGRTTTNAIVNFPGATDLIGRVVDVRIEGFGPNSLRGRLDQET